MARIVNLRQARKARNRAEKRAKADAEAAQHGRTRAERQTGATQAERAKRELDGHRRDGT